MKEERLEGNLSSLQEKMRPLVTENAAFKEQVKKLQQESGILTAEVTGLQKLLETVSAERDQLKSVHALEATQAQVLYIYIHCMCCVVCVRVCMHVCMRTCVCYCVGGGVTLCFL